MALWSPWWAGVSPTAAFISRMQTAWSVFPAVIFRSRIRAIERAKAPTVPRTFAKREMALNEGVAETGRNMSDAKTEGADGCLMRNFRALSPDN